MSLYCLVFGHNWSENRNGIRICLRCDKVDNYFGLTGMNRRMREENKDREWIKNELGLVKS